MLVNPLGSLLEQINAVVVLHHAPDTFWMSYAILTSLATFIIGMTVFHKSEPLFAENI